jgi:excinuclease UvrABC nuclease subunit
MMDNSLSDRINFSDADWKRIPHLSGVYVIYERDAVIYVGMAG